MFKDAGLKTLRALTSCDGLTSFSLPGVEEFTANAVGSVTKLKYFLCWFGLCGVLVSHGMTGMQLSNHNHKNTLIEIFPCCLRLPTFPCPSFCQIPVASASCVTLDSCHSPGRCPPGYPALLVLTGSRRNAPLPPSAGGNPFLLPSICPRGHVTQGKQIHSFLVTRPWGCECCHSNRNALAVCKQSRF